MSYCDKNETKTNNNFSFFIYIIDIYDKIFEQKSIVFLNNLITLPNNL